MFLGFAWFGHMETLEAGGRRGEAAYILCQSQDSSVPPPGLFGLWILLNSPEVMSYSPTLFIRLFSLGWEAAS